uniref:SFRICE_011010 n=1 Tax=Spodoptera frugiperda TaxID=7108 RepID=A0A2H1W359_SPOFR
MLFAVTVQATVVQSTQMLVASQQSVNNGGRGFDPFDPRLLSIKLDVVLSLNGLEVSPLSHFIMFIHLNIR